MDPLVFHIRYLLRRDFEEVLAIEFDSFEDPWDLPTLVEALRVRRTLGMVAEHDGHVIGYIVYSMFKSHFEVLNLAVAAEYRRQRVGTRLVEHLSRRLEPRRQRITLYVRERNVGGQVFFRSLGFKATRVIKDAYRTTADDAYVMEYRLPAVGNLKLATPPRQSAG